MFDRKSSNAYGVSERLGVALIDLKLQSLAIIGGRRWYDVV